MTTEEWDALAWWERRVYLEGWNQENTPEESGAAETTTEGVTFSGEPGEMAALGFKEQTL